MCLGILAELCTIGALLPFLAIIVSNQSFENGIIPSILKIVSSLGIGGDSKFQITLIFIVLSIASGSLRILLSWCTTRLSFAIGVDLGISLFKVTLSHPYENHKKMNSSETIAVITKKSDDVVFSVIYPSLVMVSAIATAMAVIVFLSIVNLVVTTVAVLMFGLFYTGILFVTRNRLAINSDIISADQAKAINIIQNAAGGIREVILHNQHDLYIKIYSKVSSRLKKSQGENIYLTTTPRYAIETFTMVIIASVAYGYINKGGNAASVIPVLGAFVLGAQRLLPSAQQIYWAIANIKGSQASLDDVITILEKSQVTSAKIGVNNKIEFNANICIKNYRYTYDKSQSNVIENCNLKINKLDKIGIIGKTGGGKSTLLDLIMRLIRPDEGEMTVDGVVVDDANQRAYQNIIAHVPQDIFLVDGTIAENIAFEISGDYIDMERVFKAARISQAHNFIYEFPNKYMTRVGERGSLLSGGQCQRIGIARALYREPTLLILDEATSALDHITEENLMKALAEIEGLTILMIAHRLKSLTQCNKIYEVSNGKLIEKNFLKEELV
jgi:ABC-type multidrug transport system fused ATPase/permease subunit